MINDVTPNNALSYKSTQGYATLDYLKQLCYSVPLLHYIISYNELHKRLCKTMVLAC